MFFLTSGHLRAPAFAFCPGARGRIDLPMAVAVVPLPRGQHLLVDCGFSARELAAPRRRLFPAGLFLDARGEGGGPPIGIAAQLAARGVDPASVRYIVATHLHFDHIGGFEDFPNAELLATPAEIGESARRGRLRGYHHGQALARSGRLVPAELRGGERHGFPAHLDLQGDGRVVLLDASGHTAGSVAVLLTDPDGRSVLHAGDAAYCPREYREGQQSLLSRAFAYRREALVATWGRLRDYESGGGEVLLAHDPAGYERLCALHPAPGG